MNLELIRWAIGRRAAVCAAGEAPLEMVGLQRSRVVPSVRDRITAGVPQYRYHSVFSVDASSQRPEPTIVVVTLSLVVDPA